MDDGDNGCVGGIKITSKCSKRFRNFRTIFFARSFFSTVNDKNDGGLGVGFDRSDDIYRYIEVTNNCIIYSMYS